ncbi:hypothetical protein BIU97_14655 [Curtobacterium sp. MCBA15_009]|uniref:hypothetical protein n=1 Tax=Curtobacterium sp. MCBA15_009 TaxID=1898737 RepID=UPI0008DD0198|nr:hypothetical protein [Curtobacterium sp. MCBA15_009]OII15406.1 hypothetical protein BIU97_14655 [Curtobacterium sp. MCBA15_009]
MRARTIAVATAAAVGLLLAGCAHADPLPADPDERLAVVKATVQRAELRTIHALPSTQVGSVRQLSTGSFLDCSSGVRWSGNIRATLSEGVDATAAQQRIAETFATRDGYDVSEDPLRRGDVRVQIIDPDGVQLLVTIWDDGTVIDVISGSACFGLPQDFDLPYEY